MPTILEFVCAMLLCLLGGCARQPNTTPDPARTSPRTPQHGVSFADASSVSASQEPAPVVSHDSGCVDSAAPLAPFGRACFEGDLAKVRASITALELDSGVDCCAPTPLMLALSPFIAEPNARAAIEGARAQRKATIAQLLLERGPNVRSVDSNGMSALHYAVTAYFLEPTANALVKRLLSQGADPNGRTVFGQTPLLMAVDRRRATIVRTLLEAGADPQAAAPDGQTPAGLAQSIGEIETARLITHWPASPHEGGVPN